MSSLPQPKRWVVVCCPVSGKKDAVQVLERDFFPKAKELGLDVKMVLTERAGHATELAAEHGSPETGLVLVGGDGTIHEAMDGLISTNMLGKVVIGLLSQGTMNFYWHSARLPDPKELATFLADGSCRAQSLMKVSTSNGSIQTNCFEAIYIGVGYEPAKGAQEWRGSLVGPMGGIMYKLVYSTLKPSSASVKGTITMHVRGSSKPVVLEDDFYWIIVTQRSPYNGALTPDSMWVSVMRLQNFPGFGRMMSAFTPPMEVQSGTATFMEEHYDVTSVTWAQDNGDIGVCLDGDPMSAGPAITMKHEKAAWNIVAPVAFPDRVADAITKKGALTKEARQWLAANPAPEGTYVALPSALEVSDEKLVVTPLKVVLAVGALAAWAVVAYSFVDPEGYNRNFFGE